MLTIAICDDEPSYLELLTLKINNCIENNLKVEFRIICMSSIEQLYEFLNTEHTDIVFLDIMVNNINSINWLVGCQQQFKKIPFIIMTGFPCETENLSEIDCCYYLLKSKMTDEQLLKAIKRSVNVVTKWESQFKTVSFGKKNITLDFHSISIIETYNNNLLIHTIDGNEISIYSSMKEFSKNLTPNFLKCHKSYTVNMNHINGYEPHKFIMSDGGTIPIPPKKYKAVISSYKNYLLNL